jgi:hypothetical protein
MTLHVHWVDHEREPQCAPDPAFPLGRDLDVSLGQKMVCRTSLPYPAKRCGHFLVSCLVCGQSIAITTAGRPDDPRSLKLACRTRGSA